MEPQCDPKGDELVYAFGPFRLYPNRQLLLRSGHPVKLSGAAFELLHLLVRRCGELLTKDELLACAWPHTVVHESNLKVNILSLRCSLGDVQAQPGYIATVHRRGYRFVATVTTSREPLGTPTERYSLVDADYAVVASICRSLDGLPLAIQCLQMRSSWKMS